MHFYHLYQDVWMYTNVWITSLGVTTHIYIVVYMCEQKKKKWKGVFFAVKRVPHVSHIVWKHWFSRKMGVVKKKGKFRGSHLMYIKHCKIPVKGYFLELNLNLCRDIFETYVHACVHQFIWVPPPSQVTYLPSKKLTSWYEEKTEVVNVISHVNETNA